MSFRPVNFHFLNELEPGYALNYVLFLNFLALANAPVADQIAIARDQVPQSSPNCQ
jgi:hypothetical protein